MQETRMTFGEHLEELRRRILFSLLYLVVGVVVAFVYEQQLMDVALGPHRRAFSGAQKTRLLERYRRLLEGVEPLRGMTPQSATIDDQPLVVGQIRWEVLFAADVEAREALASLAAPFSAAAARIDDVLESTPALERAKLSALLDDLGRGVASRVVESFAPRESVESSADIPRLLKRLEDEFRDFEAKHGDSGLFELISWGDDLVACNARFAAINAFLDDRRQQVLESKLTLADVHASATETRIGTGLLDFRDRLAKILDDMKSAHRAEIMVISYLEQFYTHFKVALIFGLLFTIPFIMYEIWKFVGAGLYVHEQRYVVTFLPFSLGLFALGGYFGYEVLIPVALTFLATWGDADIALAFTLGDYISLFFTLTLVLGLVFQTPLIMVFLTKIDLVRVETYRKQRRMAIMLGTILSAVLTPPDPFSLLLMAVPLLLLYELGILVCQLLAPRKKEASS